MRIEALTGRGTKIDARFEWLSIESNLAEDCQPEEDGNHEWNMVASRSDVSGRIHVTDRQGKQKDEVHFRGTGYHDHCFDERWLPDTLNSWQKGRVHFPDFTAIFFRFEEIDSNEESTKLYLVENGKLSEFEVQSAATDFSRNMFGLKYPSRMELTADGVGKLEINQNEIIESSFFYLRFLSEMTLTLDNGETRYGTGISEHLAPKALKYRWLDWLRGLRIRR